jgi:hypothetical protein
MATMVPCTPTNMLAKVASTAAGMRLVETAILKTPLVADTDMAVDLGYA